MGISFVISVLLAVKVGICELLVDTRPAFAQFWLVKTRKSMERTCWEGGRLVRTEMDDEGIKSHTFISAPWNWTKPTLFMYLR
jgi:hypothetical protein